MRLLLATHRFGRGGSESYLLTVAAELQRLGHAVELEAIEGGPAADRARSLGMAVRLGDDASAAAPDAALVQDAGRAYALADRHPTVPQVFVAHSELFDAQLPPQLPGLTATVVAMSERIEQRIRAFAWRPPIARLRQPVDSERFAARETIRDRPARALALSNYVYGGRLDVLRSAWEPAGVEVVAAGEEASPTDAPELLIADADIVVGKGRALLEGMSCGRAAYVYDMAGCDGWVTPERYPALEADGFAGQAVPETEDRAAVLRADLAAYSPAMGAVNRDLVTAGHGARRHAERLVELLEQATAGSAETAGEPGRLSELERLTRAQWRLEDRAAGLARESDRLHARILELEDEARRLRQTRRYRAAAAVGRPLDALRRSGR
jgi:hypothetical protein